MGTSWTTITDDITASGDWTTEADLTLAESRSWKTVLSTDAAKKDTFLGLSEAAEDFDINPEDVELAPELVQADRDEWTLEVAETD